MKPIQSIPLRLENVYDSHVHWAMTGQMSSILTLNHLNNALEVSSLQVQPFHFQGDWLVGFGWDHHLWNPLVLPSRESLDAVFPNIPVVFSRVDGHAFWVNTEALRRAGLLGAPFPNPTGGIVVRDAKGVPTGVLVDLAMDLIKALIPKPRSKMIRDHLLVGMKYFNSRGFTHIRDLSCSKEQWAEVVKLSEEGLLTLAIEQYFDAENPKNFEAALQLATSAQQVRLPYVRAQGIKVYYDGALGSEGAFLSCPYCSGSGRGFRLMAEDDLKEIMIKTWQNNLNLAVHVIGDEAAHQVVSTATEAWKYIPNGKLELEHAQMMRPETIALLMGKPVICHMQPCHWLSDRRWLKSKLGDLVRFAFPWAALEKAQIAIQFGSDSPIEESSLFNNLKALNKSKDFGISGLTGDPLRHHVHPDTHWVPQSYTNFENEKVQSVYFHGREL